MNDLWQYSITTNQWGWMGGSSYINGAGEYGVKGIPSNFTVPGRRTHAVSWTDLDGNFWMFGGVFGSNCKDKFLLIY